MTTTLRSDVLALCGLAREARIAAGDGVLTLQAGGDPARLRARLAERPPEGLRAVVSFGIAGGLDPALKPGAVVIGTAVRGAQRWQADPSLVEAWRRRLGGSGLALVAAEVAGVETAVLSPQAKAALRQETGAAAVDMESQVAAAYAAQHGLPFGILRVVCDPAERALPAFAANALKPNGDPDIAAVLMALARRPSRLGALLSLARDSGEAFRGLGRARALLGLALGVDA